MTCPCGTPDNAAGWHACPDLPTVNPIPNQEAPMPTTITRQRLTVVGPNLPREAKATFHVHAEGCADLQRGWIRRHAADAWTGEYASLVDVEAEVYDFAAAENEGYELGDYLSEFHFAPCVTLPERLEDDEPPAPPAQLVDPIAMHTSRRIVEFARTLAAELGVEDTYEDDEERVFALLVSAAEVYIEHTTESGSLGFATAIGTTVDALAENLDVVFAEELTR